MGLTGYRQKRNFTKTPEPPGGRAVPQEEERLFVIQKHAASRLHYDLRLEEGGVLKSWAVPKGPSLDPAAKRLAVQVEDHPVEYGAFEGTIPEGEYGGGSVLLWDRGRWEPIGDAAEGLRKGRLKFRLAGEKLRGGWNLVRLTDRDARDKPTWLLMKEKDEEAASARHRDILVERPESVVSGRRVEEIGEGTDAVWHSNRSQGRETTRLDPASLPGARRRPILSKPAFELATLVDQAPAGEAWLHEIKLDGFRLQCRIEGGSVRLFTRTGQDWTARFPAIAAAARQLPVHTALLDGELVALQQDGRSSFQLLQQRMSEESNDDLVYYVFDLLSLDGYDLTAARLDDRKALLRTLLEATPAGGHRLLRYSDHIVGRGEQFYAEVCRLGLEGMMSKLRHSPYRAGRGRDWLKVKCLQRQEFVVGGFTEPSGTRTGFGALLLGVYDGNRFTYTGRVGTGFNEKLLTSVHRRLKTLEQGHSPFAGKVPGPLRDIHWVRPEMVVEVAFTEWTSDGLLRHPSFEGLREDKQAADVIRERPTAPQDEKARLPASEVGAPSWRRGATQDDGRSKARKTTPRSGARSTGRADDVVEIGGIRLTHPDRVLYPDTGTTKRDLALYYDAVAQWMLPHVMHRPLMVVRCPEGYEQECFHQKHRHDRLPSAIRSTEVKEESGRRARYLMIEDQAGLIALVQIGVLEIHLWGAQAGRIEHPDRMIFDLDPDTGLPWGRVVEAARLVKERLARDGLTSWVTTTGGKGLHVVVPLAGRQGWEEVKSYSEALAEALAREQPETYTSKMSKAARRGKIFIDYLRNSRGATAIAPYSTRSRPGATVALPVAWSELSRLAPADFTVQTVPPRLRARRDPWKDLVTSGQELPVRRAARR